jgi:hypothetical protein
MSPDSSPTSSTQSSSGRTPFWLRVARTARLHADTYEEVEADPSSIVQATGIVLVSGLAGVLGAFLRIQLGTPLPGSALPLPWHLALIGLEPLVVWVIGCAFAYMVGATFLKGPETESDYRELLRTTGFSFAPGSLTFFAWLPPSEFGLGIIALAKLWVLVACIVGIRQALDFTTGRAIGTLGASFVLLWLVLWGLTVTPLPF